MPPGLPTNTTIQQRSLKFGISPQGVISFVSDCYGGRVSDFYLTEHCGILKNLLPGDVSDGRSRFHHSGFSWSYASHPTYSIFQHLLRENLNFLLLKLKPLGKLQM